MLNIKLSFNNKRILIIIGVILILGIVGWISNSYPRQSIIDDFVKNERERITSIYEQKIKEKEKEINDLKLKIISSEELLLELGSTIDELMEKKDDIKLPETDQEIRNRFHDLGYPTIQ